MARRFARYAVMVSMLVAGVVLCMDVAYLVRGSLEEFPTPEQEEKVRVVTATIAAMLVAMEVGLWWVLRLLRESAPPIRATALDLTAPATHARDSSE